MATTLAGKKVAILVADGFEQVEMTSPRDALTHAGAIVDRVSLQERQVRGWQHTEWGETFAVDRPVVAVEATGYDGLRLTSYPSIRTDVVNAGGQWQDAEVVEDRGIITSRNPDDLPAFNRATIVATAGSSVPRDEGPPAGAGEPIEQTGPSGAR